MPSIELAVLDMAGTTVTDDGLVLRAFDAAATAAGLPESGQARDAARTYVRDTMGQSKIEVFRHLFGTEDRARHANATFEQVYADSIDTGIAEVPGAATAITGLREAGVKVALTTGFSATTQRRILDALDWDDIADLVLAPGEHGRGRPFPDLILNALLRSGIDDVAKVAVLGDTSSDMVSGRRAGASIVAGTLTGAHGADTLTAAGATHVVASVADFAELILSQPRKADPA